jgi:DNA-binding NtrC family response regulator
VESIHSVGHGKERPLELIGTSPAIRLVQEELELAARSDAKVVITGESGVGKEVVARLIHEHSRRAHSPLVTINCAGVPDTLLESELFGHMRGSFTDAYRDKPGRCEMAHRGTLFLDEVGEMSARMQASLLRFLETGEIQRVGSERSNAIVDVRVIAATNRNLRGRVAEGTFREDLYYRLNVIHLTIPALRDRPEDVLPLFEHFLQHYAVSHGSMPLELTPQARECLVDYGWPGNVRELKNAAERMVVRTRGSHADVGDLPAEIVGGKGAAEPHAVRLAQSHAAVLYDRVVRGESFWSAIYEPFMSRDLTRGDLLTIVRMGLEETHGNYKQVVTLFNMAPGDYKRFLNFLRKHQCHVSFQSFREMPARMPLAAPIIGPRWQR